MNAQDLGGVLVGSGIGAILLAIVQAFINKRKLGADTAAVLSDAARDLIEPMGKRLKELSQDNSQLQHRVDDLEHDLRWLRRERADQLRRDRAFQAHMEALAEWAEEWVPRARFLGLDVPPPPRPPVLASLLDPDHLMLEQ